MRELTKHMSYQEVQREEHVIREGDLSQNFFIILRGHVRAVAKNQWIFQHNWAKKAEKSLLHWKKNYFDVRVREQMQEHLDKIRDDVDPVVIETRMGDSPQSISKVRRQIPEPMTAQPRQLKKGNDVLNTMKLGLQR